MVRKSSGNVQEWSGNIRKLKDNGQEMLEIVRKWSPKKSGNGQKMFQDGLEIVQDG